MDSCGSIGAFRKLMTIDEVNTDQTLNKMIKRGSSEDSVINENRRISATPTLPTIDSMNAETTAGGLHMKSFSSKDSEEQLDEQVSPSHGEDVVSHVASKSRNIEEPRRKSENPSSMFRSLFDLYFTLFISYYALAYLSFFFILSVDSYHDYSFASAPANGLSSTLSNTVSTSLPNLSTHLTGSSTFQSFYPIPFHQPLKILLKLINFLFSQCLPV